MSGRTEESAEFWVWNTEGLSHLDRGHQTRHQANIADDQDWRIWEAIRGLPSDGIDYRFSLNHDVLSVALQQF